jgi:nifR3 family TIM-barrel protein
MAEAARIATDSGPDVIDVNTGCPVRKIVTREAGAALLRDLDLVRRIVCAIRAATVLPLTAKCRIEWDADDIRVLELARILEGEGVSAITVHARTRAQGYDTPADWRWIQRVKAAVQIPVIGNGDVIVAGDAARMLAETGCDGIMVGRGAIGHPGIFRQIRHLLSTGYLASPPTPAERRGALLEHLADLVAELGEDRGVRSMRKQYAAYLRGIPGGSGLRQRLVRAGTAAEVGVLLGRDRGDSTAAPSLRDLGGGGANRGTWVDRSSDWTYHIHGCQAKR